MRRSILSVVLFSLIALCLPPSAAAQYDLDVKTRFEEMARLRSVKQGVKAILEDQSWASVVEFGEDYSLWLTDLERDHRGDFMHVDLQVFLRTPALLGMGEPVDTTQVQLRYHWKRMQTMAQDIPDPESIAESKAEKLGTALARVAGYSDQSVRQLGGELLSALVTSLRQYPSRVEAVESLLLGRKVARETEKMITSDEPTPLRASSPPSILSVRATPNPAAPQEPVRFSVDGQHVSRYRWAFENGTTASGRSVTHTSRRPGRHEVKVTALSSGERATQSVSVNVEATPHSRLYGAFRILMTGLSSPWSESEIDRDEFHSFLETTEQKSTSPLLSGLRNEFPGAVSDLRALLESSNRVLQKIEVQHQPYLHTQYSNALQRMPAYQEQRTNLGVPEPVDGGSALYAAVVRPLNRYARSGATAELIAAYRQANHVCPVLRYAIRSSQSVAGSLEYPLDQNLRVYRKLLGLLQEVVARDLKDRSLGPLRCTR